MINIYTGPVRAVRFTSRLKILNKYKNPSLLTQAQRCIKTPQGNFKPNDEDETGSGRLTTSVGLFDMLTLHLGITHKPVAKFEPRCSLTTLSPANTKTMRSEKYACQVNKIKP